MLLGQLQSGNSNDVIKQKFKRALAMAIDFGKVTQKQAMKLKLDLDL
jgi:hypothetical protein